jgi:hypothetical protein
MSPRLFLGYDHREAIGFHACVQTIVEQCRDVSITPIFGNTDGTNAFTLARFSVPERCNFSGFAIFIDGSDMILRADIAELWAMRDVSKAVQVVKHQYEPKAKRKYVGTELESPNEAYPRKNWSSVVIFNAGHGAHWYHREAVRDAIATGNGKYLHRFSWLDDSEIGELPIEWNWLDEYGPNDDAKLLHWTTGIPGFYQYRDAPHAQEWKAAVRRAQRGLD